MLWIVLNGMYACEYNVDENGIFFSGIETLPQKSINSIGTWSTDDNLQTLNSMCVLCARIQNADLATKNRREKKHQLKLWWWEVKYNSQPIMSKNDVIGSFNFKYNIKPSISMPTVATLFIHSHVW